MSKYKFSSFGFVPKNKENLKKEITDYFELMIPKLQDRYFLTSEREEYFELFEKILV